MARGRPTSVQVALVVSAIALAYVVVAPLAGILVKSLRGPDGAFTLEQYADLLSDPQLLAAIRNSLVVSLATAAGGVLVGAPLAFGVARSRMRGKRLVNLAVIVSFASPPFLMTVAYVLIAGPNNGYANQLLRAVLFLDTDRGPLNVFSLYGFVFLALPAAIAMVYLTVLPALGNMDPALEEASRVGGAGPVTTLLRVSLPVLRPGVLAGALLAFSTALAMYATPQILGLDVLTVAIRRSLLVTGDYAAASAIATVSAVFSLVVLFLYRRSIRYATRFQTVAGRGFRPGAVDAGWFRHVFTWLGLGYAFFGALLPYSLLLYASVTKVPSRGLAWSNLTLANYGALWTDPKPRTGLQNSVFLGLTAAAIITVLGFLLAIVVTRSTVRGRAIVDYVSILPLGIAGTAFAVGVIVIHLQPPLADLGLYGTVWLMLIAYIGRYVPFGVRSAQVSLLQISPALEEASRVCGASHVATLTRITLPLIRAGLAYAFILGFLQTFSEVSTSVMLRGPDIEVASTALLALQQGPGGLPKAAALSVVMFAVSMVLVFLAQLTGRRHVGTS